MRIIGLRRDHQKPMTKEDMEMEILFRSQIGAVHDPAREFTDSAVDGVLVALGLGDLTRKSQDNARTNLDTRT